MEELVLEVKDLTLRAPGGRVLKKSLRFSLQKGEILSIHGSNGSGKSTLARKLFSNSISQDVEWHIPIEGRAYLPQTHQSQIFLPLTIMDVVCLDRRHSRQNIIKWQLLPEDRLYLKWNSASGGEQKRTLMTRMILKAPNVLCLDEPFNNLDSESRAVIARFIDRFLSGDLPGQVDPGSVILISHDPILEWSSSNFSIQELRL